MLAHTTFLSFFLSLFHFNQSSTTTLSLISILLNLQYFILFRKQQLQQQQQQRPTPYSPLKTTTMGILTTQDKEKVKRAIPKANNKIIDATVARLYIAYPDPTKWAYTGLVGAIALVDDLVGHTFFLKLVDIIGHRGVLWDQELYVDFEYNQDRKYFHTFEIEECFVGLLFEDTNDATHFYKRVTTRQKYGSSATVKNKSAIALKERIGSNKSYEIPGPRGEFMDVNTAQRQRRAKGVLYYDDVPPPEWRSLYAELEAAGITEDMIADNRQFIKDYISQQGGPLVGLEPPIPRKFQRKHEIEHSMAIAEPLTVSISSSSSNTTSKHKKAPPPPPPPSGPTSQQQQQQQQQSTTVDHHYPLNESKEPSYSPSPSPTSTSTSTPEPESHEITPAKPRFRLPPSTAIAPPVRNTSLPPNGPQFIDKPLPKVPLPLSPVSPQAPNHAYPTTTNTNTNTNTNTPFNHSVHQVPPPPPARATPPAPPPRARTNQPGLPPRNTPGLPPRTNNTQPPPAPPPRASRGAVPPPPPPPPRATRAPMQLQLQSSPQSSPISPPAQQQQQQQYPSIPPRENTSAIISSPPPAPPLPQQPRPTIATPQQQQQQLPQATTSSVASPAPPLPPQMNQTTQQTPATTTTTTTTTTTPSIPAPPPPPPAPPMPDMSNDTSTSANTGGGISEATGDAGRDALLASIRGAGIGVLKKTDKSQLEKPSILLQEAKGETPQINSNTGTSSNAPPATLADAPPATLADALASALNKRKEKVAQSDDEEDDDW